MSHLAIIALSILLTYGCNAWRGSHRQPESTDLQRDAASLLAYMTPDEVNLAALEDAELAQERYQVKKILEEADALARSRIGYRTDKRDAPLTRAYIGHPPENLSCTEFIWLIYSSAGLDLGNFHIETKEMAYDKGVYEPYLVKLRPSTAVRPGDTLIYEYPDEELIREEEEAGRYRSGHAVMVVSSDQKIVIGSHGDESTPLGAPTGVGYRRLLTDWSQWTAGRTLKAIYRLREDYNMSIKDFPEFARPMGQYP